MQTPSLMQRAQAKQPAPGPEAAPAADASAQPGGEFQRPDIKALVPPEQADAVQRIVAAGMKLMYAPEMREELQAEVGREGPPAQKMAQGVVGLMLTMDKQAQGGLPNGAIFPAALELLGEAAEVLIAAGQPVTQEDYNEAVRMSIVLIAKALDPSATPEQVMGGLQQGMPPGLMEAEAGAAPAQPGAPGAMPTDEEPMP